MCGNRFHILAVRRIEGAEFQADFLRSLAGRNENVFDARGSGCGVLFDFRRIDAEAGEFERGSFERFQRAVSPQIHGKGQSFTDFSFCGGERCFNVPLADESEELRVSGARRQGFDFERRQSGAERVAYRARASEERVVEEIVERRRASPAVLSFDSGNGLRRQGQMPERDRPDRSFEQEHIECAPVDLRGSPL